MMDEPTLAEWLDRHHVEVIRTQATLLDGTSRGEYAYRSRLEDSLPVGSPLPDQAIYLAPDLNTLISDGTDANLGHVICNLSTEAGAPLPLCPRTKLIDLLSVMTAQHLNLEVDASIAFCLYTDAYDALRTNHYRIDAAARPIAPANPGLHTAYHASAYMNEVVKRLQWKHIGWQGWRNKPGRDQLELDLAAADPLTLADNIVRTRLVMFEVAVDLGLAVTFMARPSANVHNTLDFRLRLTGPAEDLAIRHWTAGLITTRQAATSFCRPGGNAYRAAAADVAPRPFHVRPTDTLVQVYYPGGAASLNPYLALAAFIAGGQSGIEAGLSDETVQPDLPLDMKAALDLLAECAYLKETLGEDFVGAWLDLQQNECREFQSQTRNAMLANITDWEFAREFERF